MLCAPLPIPSESDPSNELRRDDELLKAEAGPEMPSMMGVMGCDRDGCAWLAGVPDDLYDGVAGLDSGRKGGGGCRFSTSVASSVAGRSAAAVGVEGGDVEPASGRPGAAWCFRASEGRVGGGGCCCCCCSRWASTAASSPRKKAICGLLALWPGKEGALPGSAARLRPKACSGGRMPELRFMCGGGADGR